METQADWDTLDIDGVDAVIDRAARSVSARMGVDAGDLRQEAYLLVATKPDLQEAIEIGDGPGLLHFRLVRDLIDSCKTEVSRAGKATSYEERYDDSTDYAPAPVAMSLRNDTSAYTRELVEQLLPAVWDDSFAYGMQAENAPDADMPRGSANKATGGTLAAHLADIKYGWRRAPLTRNERCALLLGYGFDLTQVESGRILGVSQKSISNWLYSGVGKIVARLNGDTNLADYLSVMDEQLVEAGVA